MGIAGIAIGRQRIKAATMEDIINLIVSNGIGVACIVYFMFRDYKFQDNIAKTLTSLQETTDLIKNFLLERGNDGK